jgi:hypothetical protein
MYTDCISVFEWLALIPPFCEVPGSVLIIHQSQNIIMGLNKKASFAA